MDPDEARALYDILCIGPQSESHAFQAKITANILMNSQARDDQIITQLVTMYKKTQVDTSMNNHVFPELDVDKLTSLVLEQIMNSEDSSTHAYSEPPSQPYSETYSNSRSNPIGNRIGKPVEKTSLSDCFTLANDLLLVQRDNVESNQTPDTHFKAPPSSSSINSNIPPQVTSQTRAVPTSKREERPPPSSSVNHSPAVRVNPFVTAKEKYEEEGHVFPSKPNNATSTTNSNTPSNSQNYSRGITKPPMNNKPSNQDDDSNLVQKIESDIIVTGAVVTFADIAGLDFAKKCVQELIVWPMSRPDLFRGLREVPKGILLFGPPGTGKTLIGKAIAHSSGATFFNISASSLTSKWIGEGEKTVRILFSLATLKQPSVVFIDEVDSLLSVRTSDDNDASRRIKTEFLVQLDGAGTDSTAKVVVIGATNRPEELDEGARRRFVKRLYIPLPDETGRRHQLERLLRDCEHCLSNRDLDSVVQRTKGYSGADMRALCTEAAMGPVRRVIANGGCIAQVREHDVSPVSALDFDQAVDAVAPSVSESDLLRYVNWNGVFGSYRKME